MKRYFAFLVAAAVFLGGCAAPQTMDPTLAVLPSATANTVTTTVASTAVPTTPAIESTPSAAATQDEAVPATGMERRVFVIVPQESSVSYQVGEVFFNQNNRFNLAVGVTQQISGEITLDPAAPDQSSAGPVTVDISAFTSDSTRRDNAIRDRWLESRKFPIATFTPTEVRGIPADAKEGDLIDFEIAGDLTVRDTTRPVVFAVQAELQGDRLTGTATTAIKMTDFNFQPPDIAGMLKAEDDVRIEFKFVAVPKV